MAVSSSNLVDSFVPQLINFKRVGLEGIAVPIFGHLRNDRGTVAELTHLSTSPSVQVAFLIAVVHIVR